MLAHQKPSSGKAAKSHLSTQVRKCLGKVLLHELTPLVQRNFVTLMSQKVSRKTVLNILGVLSSMMRTAKSRGCNVQPIVTSELALPAAQVQKQPRFFNGEEARRIIMIAGQP